MLDVEVHALRREPGAHDLQRRAVGPTVEMQEATSYAAVIEALRAGQVDICSMGPFSYVVAKDGDAGFAYDDIVDRMLIEDDQMARKAISPPEVKEGTVVAVLHSQT